MLLLAERREVRFPSGEFLRTPFVVPSFSSRVPDVEKIFRASEEFIDGPFLISAYDIASNHITPPFAFGAAVFLDSGGYEIGPDSDLGDVSSEPTGSLDDWTPEKHAAVVQAWSAPLPTVVITYDHPRLRTSFSEQIDRGLEMSLPQGDCVRELLLKPETNHQRFLNIENLATAVRRLGGFQAIGVTEKEIGNSVFERMLNIAKLRKLLHHVGLQIPIHVFGSLDSVTTLFYFVAGADIFDGLTWLRYAFKDGHTMYRQDFGITEFGITTKAPKVEALCWAKNHQYLKDMELEMRRFLATRDFNAFRFHTDALKAAYENVIEEVGA